MTNSDLLALISNYILNTGLFVNHSIPLKCHNLGRDWAGLSHSTKGFGHARSRQSYLSLTVLFVVGMLTTVVMSL